MNSEEPLRVWVDVNELYMDFSDMKEMQKVADRISEITGVKNITS